MDVLDLIDLVYTVLYVLYASMQYVMYLCDRRKCLSLDSMLNDHDAGLNALTKDSTVLPLDAYGGAYSARHAAALDHGTSHIR